MNDLFSPPTAGFDDPLEILRACHERILRNCALIGRIASHVAGKGLDAEARQAAASVLRYFRTAGRDHHRDEEDDLFPALLHAAPSHDHASVEALLARLRADHRVLDELWERVRVPLQAAAEGRALPFDESLVATLADAYDRHIAEEETVLFPLARRLLSAQTLAALGESMAERRGVLAQ